MAVTLKVESPNEEVKVRREGEARRVLSHFGDRLPASRLLCFLDDVDSSLIKEKFGPDNRGGYVPIHDNTPTGLLPDYVRHHILIDDGGKSLRRVVDDLIYTHGSTCANELGLTMTLAHELEHAIQHANVRELWALNYLVLWVVPKTMIEPWSDIPTERQARIVSKGVAVDFFGEGRVRAHVDQKIAESVTKADTADWRFVGALTTSDTVDLDAETRKLFRRLGDYRAQLEAALQEMKRVKNADFLDISLDSYF